jgi:hypothetical protein
MLMALALLIAVLVLLMPISVRAQLGAPGTPGTPSTPGAASNPLGGATPGGTGGCASGTPECSFVNTSVGVTTYPNAGGNITATPSTVENATPIISQVIKSNDNISAYLITCPSKPDPTNSLEYITNPGSFIGGDECIASAAPLNTTVTLSTTDTPNPDLTFINAADFVSGTPPAQASSSYTIGQMANGTITELGFSGETTSSNGIYNLSNAYDTESYIFQGINSTPQENLWTWSANYANLSKVDLSHLNLEYQSSDGYTAEYEGVAAGETDTDPPIPGMYPLGCEETYSFKLASFVKTLTNANMVVPVYNKSTNPAFSGLYSAEGMPSSILSGTNSADYVVIGGYLYSPVTTTSAPCTQMSTGGPGCKTGSGTWLKIGYGASAHYGGQTYNNLPIYVSVANTMNINQFGGAQSSLISSLFGSGASSGNNIKYIVPLIGGGSGSASASSAASTFLQAIAPNAIAFGNVTIFPYFTYNAQLPATYAQFTVPTALNLSYDVYSPNNYAGINPQHNPSDTFVEPYLVYSGAGLIANYTPSGTGVGEAVSFPYNITGASNSTFEDQFPIPANVAPQTGGELEIWAEYVPTSGVASPGSGPVYLGQGVTDALTSNCKSGDKCDVCLGSTCFAGSSVGTSVANGVGSATYSCTTTGSSICNTIGTYSFSACDENQNTYFPGLNWLSIGGAPSVQQPEACSDIVTLQVQQSTAPPPIRLMPSSSNTLSGLLSSPSPNCDYATAYANEISTTYCVSTLTNSFQVTGNTITAPNSPTLDNKLSGTVSQSTNSVLSSATNPSAKAVHPSLGFLNITSPAFITEAPDGDLYIINYSSTTGFLGFSGSSAATLFTLRFIPSGYYNYSVYQPTQLVKQTGLGNWINQSKQYFEGSLLAHTPQLYVLNKDLFSGTTYSDWNFFGTTRIGVGTTVQAPFMPLAAASDFQDDLFLVGAHLSTARSGAVNIASVGSAYGEYSANPPSFALAEQSKAGAVIVDTVVTDPSGFQPSQEMAVSPDGGFVYLANVSYPAINIYSTTGGTFKYIGNIPLTYSNATSNLSIAKYLSFGGPYYSNDVASAYKSATGANDLPSNHHPIAIAEVQGDLFVLDNWTFSVNNQQSAIWMLRVFDSNNIEIPLAYNSNKTTAPVYTLAPQQINAFSQTVPPYGWPPYGWPITANISTGSGYNSICEYAGSGGCTAHGNADGYLSIGPQITASTAGASSLGVTGPYGPSASTATNPGGTVGGTSPSPTSLGISSDFNGNLYIIVHDKVASSPYTELIVIRSTVENYTKISSGAMPFSCYINTTSSATSSSANAPDCVSDPFIGKLYPPVLGMPDAFEYVSGLGSPLDYFAFQSAYSSLFPEGINSVAYQQQAGNLFNNGITNPTTTTIDYNSLSGGAPTIRGAPPTYVNDKISGYVITPYYINYTVNQSWSFTQGTPTWETPDISWDEANPCDFSTRFSPTATGGGTTSGGVGYVVSTKRVYYYKVGPLGSNPLNQTIEGGSTYLQNLFSNASYIPNISDANLIIPPDLPYKMFSNRIFGEIYTNQTISPATAQTLETSSSQLLENPESTNLAGTVVNATRNFNYSNISYQQISSLGTFPGYITQNAAPVGTSTNNTILGADCGSSCPDNYYYGQNYSSDNSTLNYSLVNETHYFPLFTLFARASHVYGLDLDLWSDNDVLGYNRLVYNYVDRFNNTIHMPLDVDFADPTIFTLNVSPAINQTNPNKTRIQINGTLSYVTQNGVFPVPSGSPVYLYYGTNINYANATDSSSDLPYYKYAINCAFAPTSKSCILANPLSTAGMNSDDAAALAKEANTTTYKSNYNSSGDCSPQPNSLLAASLNYNCNIYGTTSGSAANNNGQASQLPAVATGPDGNTQYCVPVFINGTGYLTSQLGLIGAVQTGSNGNFSDNITACGVGPARIIAQYYGWPPPEPIIINQTSMPHSVISYSSNTVNDVEAPEYNYYYAPNITISGYQIGNYQLSLGSVYAWIPIIVIIVLLLAAKASTGSTGSIFELLGFVALYNLVSGVAGGGVGKSLTRPYGMDTTRLRDRTTGIMGGIGAYRERVPPVLQRPTPSPPPPPNRQQGLVRMAVPPTAHRGGTRGAIGGRGGPSPGPQGPVGPARPEDAVNDQNYYKYLGLATAPTSFEELRKAYRAKAMETHPDINKNDPNAEEKFKIAQRAYDVGRKKWGKAKPAQT